MNKVKPVPPNNSNAVHIGQVALKHASIFLDIISEEIHIFNEKYRYGNGDLYVYGGLVWCADGFYRLMEPMTQDNEVQYIPAHGTFEAGGFTKIITVNDDN